MIDKNLEEIYKSGSLGFYYNTHEANYVLKLGDSNHNFWSSDLKEFTNLSERNLLDKLEKYNPSIVTEMPKAGVSCEMMEEMFDFVVQKIEAQLNTKRKFINKLFL